MTKKPMLIIFLIILVIVAILGVGVWRHYEKDNSSNNTSTRKEVKQVGIAKSLSNNNSGTQNTAVPAKTPNGTGLQQSESTDTNGTTPATTSQNDWVTSVSGNITLEEPIADTTITSGTQVAGSAKSATTVDYRLSDNSIGVLTQGSLSVANGKFSGILYFTPKSNKGQLDVFTTNSMGVELDEIQIGVNF
jgi:hypothetical protein